MSKRPRSNLRTAAQPPLRSLQGQSAAHCRWQCARIRRDQSLARGSQRCGCSRTASVRSALRWLARIDRPSASTRRVQFW